MSNKSFCLQVQWKETTNAKDQVCKPYIALSGLPHTLGVCVCVCVCVWVSVPGGGGGKVRDYPEGVERV